MSGHVSNSPRHRQWIVIDSCKQTGGFAPGCRRNTNHKRAFKFARRRTNSRHPLRGRPLIRPAEAACRIIPYRTRTGVCKGSSISALPCTDGHQIQPNGFINTVLHFPYQTFNRLNLMRIYHPKGSPWIVIAHFSGHAATKFCACPLCRAGSVVKTEREKTGGQRFGDGFKTLYHV